ncbi:MAG: YjgP/YjgQ family permease, partial [Phototrophicales bacterium]
MSSGSKLSNLKKVDLLVLRAFAGPFMVTFFIVLLFFVLQFFYIYIDDFVGKGLAWYIVLELILYLSANVVPIALPLAVLLSSIMAFGALGERYELTALKSSGISLGRFMRSAIVATFLLSVGSLAFSNYVMPNANLKFYTTLFDITQSKPALDIEPNKFYTDIDNYVIK